jgi:hypothetical protein
MFELAPYGNASEAGRSRSCWSQLAGRLDGARRK